MVDFPDFQCLRGAPAAGTNSFTCADDYTQKTGGSNQWYQVGGKGGGNSVANCAECAALCNGLPATECKAYECSTATNKCGLMSFLTPETGPTAGNIFCSRDASLNAPCELGYTLKTGSTDNWYSIAGRGGGETVASCEVCGDLCTSYDACQSYECSLSSRRCALMPFSEPKTGPWSSFFFCSKQ